LLINSLPLDTSPEVLSKLPARLAPQFSRIFSFRKEYYGERGELPYHKPRGWVRFAVDAPENILRNWCVAYHGTSWVCAARILTEGLRNPDAAGNVQVAHGQSGSLSQLSIYLTPAVGYAAFPVYSRFHEVGPEHWVQCVLQVRVRPGSFKEQAGTLGNKYWKDNLCFDEDVRSLNNLEWLIENPQDHAVCGVLVREFGPSVSSELYGLLTTRVHSGDSGPQFEWSKLLSQKFNKKRLYLT